MSQALDWIVTVYGPKREQLTRFSSNSRRALLDFVVRYWLIRLDGASRLIAARWLESSTPQRAAITISNVELSRSAEFLPAIRITEQTKIVYGRRR